MTQATGKQYPIGLRYGAAFSLTSAGLPNATSATVPYEGVQFKSADTLDLTIPDMRTIVHPGDDRVAAVDYLPTLDAVTGTLTVSLYDLDLIALLTGVKKVDIGESYSVSWFTDLQGGEPSVGLFLYQQSLNDTVKARNWRSIWIPSCRCIPKPNGMNATQTSMQFMIAVNPVSAQLWGTGLTVATNGATEHGFVEMQTEYKPWLANWLGNGTATEFSFSAAHQAQAVAKIACFDNGLDVTATYTNLVSKVTAPSPVTAAHIVSVLYEQAA
jgi:hypothetical protein